MVLGIDFLIEIILVKFYKYYSALKKNLNLYNKMNINVEYYLNFEDPLIHRLLLRLNIVNDTTNFYL